MLIKLSPPLMTKQVKQTADGSSTVFSSDFNQHYHNPNGSVSESLHVFFEMPRVFQKLLEADALNILEVGFGTGLNFLLLLDFCMKQQITVPVRFYSVEAYPLQTETAAKLDFSKHLQHPELNNLLPTVFSELQPGSNYIKPVEQLDVELHLFVGTFEEFSPQDLRIDFIFHDPFSPEVNAELWTMETFQKLKISSKSETILATYCAASRARAAMAAAGWFVARAPGALGKREMTLAALDETKLTGLKRVNEKRLSERYQNGDFN